MIDCKMSPRNRLSVGVMWFTLTRKHLRMRIAALQQADITVTALSSKG